MTFSCFALVYQPGKVRKLKQILKEKEILMSDLNSIDWSKCVICQKVSNGFVRYDLNAFQ